MGDSLTIYWILLESQVKKLSILILCCFFNSSIALSQNKAASNCSIESARQLFNNAELPLYSVHFFTQLPGYWSSKKNFIEQLPESLSILDWTALVHLGLFMGSVYENRVIPGLQSQNASLRERILVADNELYMPFYGYLVLSLQACVASGYCDPTGILAVGLDQYFAVHDVLTAALGNGNMTQMEHSTKALSVVTGLVQMGALSQGSGSSVYKNAAYYRGLYLTGLFLLLGLNTFSTAATESFKFFSCLQMSPL